MAISEKQKKPAEVFAIAGNHEKAEKRSVVHHRD
jgi:DNA repair exonuclease SbcCD nuclease subunit